MIRDKYEQIDEVKINNYIDEGKEENLRLDFKLTETTDFSRRNDRKNFAKSLSGFANSSGGLIVWGVEANDNNEEGIDCASGKQEIENIGQFLTKLNEYTGDATSPVVEGVLHKSVETSNGKGFAISLVPESINGPHMAKLGEDRYYKRSGDSFYKMEHFDVADMFGRRPRPELHLRAQPIGIHKRHRPREQSIEILLCIQNMGRGTAKAPFLAVDLPENARVSPYGLDGNGEHGLPRLTRHSSGDNEHHFGSNQEMVIHPETIVQVTKILTPLPEGTMNIDHIDIYYSVAAEDVRIENRSVRISQSHIHKFLEDREII
jgi:hypothetical protein